MFIVVYKTGNTWHAYSKLFRSFKEASKRKDALAGSGFESTVGFVDINPHFST